MFVSQHSQPPTQSLVELIQLCGGTVSKTVRQAGICIGRYSGRRPEGSRIVSEQWVLGEMLPSFRCVVELLMGLVKSLIMCRLPIYVITDSITHLKQMSYDDYYLEWRMQNFASFDFEVLQWTNNLPGLSPCLRPNTAGRGSSWPPWPWVQEEGGYWKWTDLMFTFILSGLRTAARCSMFILTINYMTVNIDDV